MTDALDEEQRLLLRDAARKAGVPELEPRIVELAEAYVEARTPPGEALTGIATAERLRDRAKRLRDARCGLQTLHPLEREALGPEGGAYVDQLALCLPAMEAALSRAEREALHRGRRKLDRAPGSPRWRLVMSLAEAWHEAGGHVGWGPGAGFTGLVLTTFAAIGDSCPEPMVREAAQAWQARDRNGGVPGAETGGSATASRPAAGHDAPVERGERRREHPPVGTRQTAPVA